jgi:hypothetical protein
MNRLHVLLRDLFSDTVGKQLSADAASRLLRRVRLGDEPARTRKQMALIRHAHGSGSKDRK